MALMFIDTEGESSLKNVEKLVESDDDVDFEGSDLNPSRISLKKPREQKSKTSAVDDIDLEEFEADMGWSRTTKKVLFKKPLGDEELSHVVDPLEKILKKSAITPGFEKLTRVPRYEVTRRQRKARAERERERSKGKKWFNLPATEMTDEVKHDLEIIQMRSVLDPKQFYKKNDVKALPKFFQIGKVLDTPLDFYHGRLTKKQRKRTIVDELMADADFAKYNKRKYKEIVDEKRQMHYKAHRHARKLKGKRK
ncbi:deoxynucleotidyltransferase terminal-interacting protein 2 [Fopius arisanus]|uniref:Deoxynucleotidyltransferase terminal-interacting protein 2 n=1 Tax=Fopius arisanus TaxID=64838 RepID=A0A9R1T843_9HYME|nr:PREDICTED: deoxynucleotidyltransferase terminal-interacting protein 2 [Fopius arisanus]